MTGFDRPEGAAVGEIAFTRTRTRTKPKTCTPVRTPDRGTKNQGGKTMNTVKFCSKCKGMGYVTRITGNAHRFGIRASAGKPWTKTVERSKNARLQVVVPKKCAKCRGTGYK